MILVFPRTLFKISSSWQLLPRNPLKKKLFYVYKRYFSLHSCRSHAPFLGCICGIMWTRSFLQTSENYEQLKYIWTPLPSFFPVLSFLHVFFFLPLYIWSIVLCQYDTVLASSSPSSSSKNWSRDLFFHFSLLYYDNCVLNPGARLERMKEQPSSHCPPSLPSLLAFDILGRRYKLNLNLYSPFQIYLAFFAFFFFNTQCLFFLSSFQFGPLCE